MSLLDQEVICLLSEHAIEPRCRKEAEEPEEEGLDSSNGLENESDIDELDIVVFVVALVHSDAKPIFPVHLFRLVKEPFALDFGPSLVLWGKRVLKDAHV